MALGRRSAAYRFALKAHKWAGLTAAVWLLVLGATGVVLDHDEWRWARQMTVPESWLSARVGRLLPATVMRHVKRDPADERRWIGGSERGMWLTEDRGQSWAPVSFDGLDSAPQVTDLVARDVAELNGVVVSTDDGLWITKDRGRSVARLGMAGRSISVLSRGAEPGWLLGVADHERPFRVKLATPDAPEWIDVSQVVVDGLPESVSLYRFVFELHFGYGLWSRTASTLINDYGGVALVVLSVTGLLFWWLPKRWRARPGRRSPRRKRQTWTWLFRFHAPVVGLLAVLPILYLAVTGVLLDHVQGFNAWAKDVPIDRESLPPVWRYRSLAGEIDDLVGYPGSPGRLSAATRYGVLHTEDDGRTWHLDRQLPPGGGNLFRVDDRLFFSNNARNHYWRRDGDASWEALSGPTTALTDAAHTKGEWILKNSRHFYLGGPDGEFAEEPIAFPPLQGATMYLFLVDVHTGNVFHPQFKWVNDAVGIMAIVLILTGPILWWRIKWR